MIVYDYPTSTEEGVFPTRKDEKGMVRNESISGINQGRTLTLKAELNAAYEDAKGKGLKLDMSRGNLQSISWI